MPGNGGPRRVPHEDGLAPAVGVFPHRLPEYARASLHPRHVRGGDDELAGTSLISRSPIPPSAPGRFQGFAHHFAETSRGDAPYQPAWPLMKKVGVPVTPERAALAHVLLHVRRVTPAVQASREGLPGHAHLLRVCEQLLPAEVRLGHEGRSWYSQKRPTSPAQRAATAAGRARSWKSRGESPEDQAHLTRELHHHLAQHLLGTLAEGSLVIRELDDGDGGLRGALGHDGDPP